ncbi:respiratory chain complex I subunit 1 family protein [candidate division KSB1 bacterium]
MENVGVYILAFIVFPGILFSSVAGLVLQWVDRKVSARIQWRKGPPFAQPFYDILKLMGKELLIPRVSSKTGFLLAPLSGFVGIALASTILWMTNINPAKSFVGDLIVVFYLLIIPSLAIIWGAASSGNPFSAIGASREMKLILGYELPLIIAVLVVAFKLRTLSLGDIILIQQEEGLVIGNISVILAFLVTIICSTAKLGLPPFDMAEADTELMEGVLLEYSGVALCMIKLTQAMSLFVLPVFLATVFLGGLQFYGWHIVWSIVKILGVTVLFILIKNTNPRLRIDTAVKFFWKPMTFIAVIAMILSYAGY